MPVDKRENFQLSSNSITNGSSFPITLSFNNFSDKKFLFYKSLSAIEKFRNSGTIKKRIILRKLKKNLEALKELSSECNGEDCNKALLIQGAIAQYEGSFSKSISFYDRSIALAKDEKLHVEEAIANELAAVYSIENGNTEVASQYAAEAVNAYRCAGLDNRATDFQELYSDILRFITGTDNSDENSTIVNTSIRSNIEYFDLQNVIRASHLISGEIILENLLEQLLKILSENSGADRVFLIADEDDNPVIKAMCVVNQNIMSVNESIPVVNPELLPITVVNYVKRTLSPILLHNASKKGNYTDDQYIYKNSVKSILCFPLIKQNNLNWIVYLENRYNTGVFSEGRLEIINLFSTQAAISLENALLFEKTKRAESELLEQYEEIQSQYEELATMNEEMESTYRELLDANDSLAIFKKFTDTSSQGMCMIETNGKINYLNPALCTMLEESNAQFFIGEKIENYYRDEYLDRFSDEVFPALQKDSEWSGEMHLVSARGNYIPVIQNFFNIRDNLGKVLCHATIVTDLTDRKKLEEQLLQSQKIEAIGRLAGGIAHDFNNLLTAIIGYSQLILSGMPPDDKHRPDLYEILKAADRSASLTRQLLAFSRKQMLQQKNLDLNHIIKNMEKMLVRILGENINLLTILPENLPPVMADKGQIEQVILNITVNSVDVMPDGGNITITTSRVKITEKEIPHMPDSRQGIFVCMTIKDDGTGIDEENLKMIFEPFFSTKGPDKGTGLGLSVVHGIIAQHNGWINVTSKTGSGTKFCIYLPASDKKLQNDKKEITGEYLKSGNGEKILLIEDQREVINFTSKALRNNGYVVYEAADGKSAIELLEKLDYDIDLLFSDVVLPDCNGSNLADSILLKKPELSIILSSGYTDQKSQWESIREKGYKFLEKPYSLNDLLNAINNMLNEQHDK